MKITLAKKDYDLPEEFTLGQIKRISVLTAGALAEEPDHAKRVEMIWDRRLAVVIVALKPQWPDLTPEMLEGFTISNDEIMEAYLAILGVAGLAPRGQAKPGEAQAETSSDGEGSTAE